MSKITYIEPPSVKDDLFDEYQREFFEAVTDIQDPGDADGTLADITTKFNALLASLREQIMR